MSDWTQLIETGFQKLGELAGKYGPPAIDTATQVVLDDAIGGLVRGVVRLALGGAILAGGLRLVSWGCERRKKEVDRIAKENEAHGPAWRDSIAGDYATHQIIPGVAIAAGAVVFLIVTIYGLTDQWIWIALWNPKLALAAKVVHALPGFSQ